MANCPICRQQIKIKTPNIEIGSKLDIPIPHATDTVIKPITPTIPFAVPPQIIYIHDYHHSADRIASVERERQRHLYIDKKNSIIRVAGVAISLILLIFVLSWACFDFTDLMIWTFGLPTIFIVLFAGVKILIIAKQK